MEFKKIENHDSGEKIYSLIKKMFPICRSITGNGVRKTLKIIKNNIPIVIKEIPSGTQVFDWTIPKEWNIKKAYIKNSKGEKIVDFKKSNLHVLNYSIPIHKKMSLKELKPHLHTLPEYPDWIPYLTSYYKERWGFCLTHNQYTNLNDDTYEVFIDSSLKDGLLTFGELLIKGETKDEVLFSCYLCHPSLCNDNLSGVSLLTFLAKYLLKQKLKYSYRFLFIPETIGAITWLSLNEKNVHKIKHGLVATCVGDPGNSTYKKSRIGDTLIDKAVEKVLIDSEQPYKIVDFFPSGSDERQFCSPGFNLPIGSLVRTLYGNFPEYHTSADNLDFIKHKALEDSFKKYLDTIFILENNKTYINTNSKCEPQLGKRGLYQTLGSQKNNALIQDALMWTLNMADGTNSTLDIASKSKMKFKTIKEATDILEKNNLLKNMDSQCTNMDLNFGQLTNNTLQKQ
jgi:aminopeptidase-like protein